MDFQAMKDGLRKYTKMSSAMKKNIIIWYIQRLLIGLVILVIWITIIQNLAHDHSNDNVPYYDPAEHIR